MEKKKKGCLGAFLGALIAGSLSFALARAAFGPIPTGPASGMVVILFLAVAGAGATAGMLAGALIGYCSGTPENGGDARESRDSSVKRNDS